MSSRAQRRRDAKLNSAGTHQFVSTGIEQEARSKFKADLPPLVKGAHMWIIGGVWRVASPTAETYNLDMENLISIDGPGCFWCEALYGSDMASEPCPGDASA